MKLNILLTLGDLPDDLTAVEFEAAVEALRATLRLSGVTVQVRRVTRVSGRPFEGPREPPKVNAVVPPGRPS